MAGRSLEFLEAVENHLSLLPIRGHRLEISDEGVVDQARLTEIDDHRANVGGALVDDLSHLEQGGEDGGVPERHAHRFAFSVDIDPWLGQTLDPHSTPGVQGDLEKQSHRDTHQQIGG